MLSLGDRKETSWKQKTTGAGCPVEDGRMQLLLSSSFSHFHAPLHGGKVTGHTHPGRATPRQGQAHTSMLQSQHFIEPKLMQNRGATTARVFIDKNAPGSSHTVLIQLVQKQLKKF